MLVLAPVEVNEPLSSTTGVWVDVGIFWMVLVLKIEVEDVVCSSFKLKFKFQVLKIED